MRSLRTGLFLRVYLNRLQPSRSSLAPIAYPSRLSSTQQRWSSDTPAGEVAPVASTPSSGSSGGQPAQVPLRTFLSELNRIKAEYLRQPNPQQRALALAAIEATPLASVANCDAKAVMSLLSTLSVVAGGNNVGAVDSRLVEESAKWIVKNLALCTPVALASVLYHSSLLRYQRLPQLIEVLQASLLSALPTLPPTSIAMIASSAMTAGKSTGAGSEIVIQSLEQFSANVDSASASDHILVLRSLGRYRKENPLATLSLLVANVFEQIVGRVEALDEESALSLQDKATMLEIMASGPGTLTPSVQVLASRLWNGIKTNLGELNPSTQLAILAAWWPKGGSVRKEIVAAIEDAISETIEQCEPSDVAGLVLVTEGKLKRPVQILDQLVALQLHSLTEDSAPASSVSPQLLTAASKYASAQEKVTALTTRLLADPQHLPIAMVGAILADHRLLNAAPDALKAAIAANNTRWSVSEIASLLSTAVSDNALVRDIARSMAAHCASIIKDAPLIAAVELVEAYGIHHVREESLCGAATEKIVLQKKDLSQSQVVKVVNAFNRVDYRNAKIFMELLPALRASIHTLNGPQVCVVAAAYAKVMVWNYKLYARLADQALERRSEIDCRDMCTLLSAFCRVELRHDRLFKAFMKQVKENAPQIGATDALQLLVAFSDLHLWDPQMYDQLAAAVVKPGVAQLTADEIGRMLLSFAKVDLRHRQWFDTLLMRTLEVAPSASPAAIANIIVAFAEVEYKQEELFSIFAERVLAMKSECPALTAAAVLVAFAKVNLKNDKLFIELIPRVRFVAHHGTIIDVTNVLTAYTSVGLWHYKLFVRLAERAITLRADCRGPQIVAILAAFAKVEMRLEKLFIEFSPRIQSLMHTLTGLEMASIVHSYATVRILDAPIFTQIAERAITLKDEFDEETATIMAKAFQRIGFQHDEFFRTFSDLLQKSATSGQTPASEQPSVDGQRTETVG